MYDHLYQEIYHSGFKGCDWSEFYRDALEAIPINTPDLVGRRLISACLLKVTMQEKKCLADQDLFFLSMQTWQ